MISSSRHSTDFSDLRCHAPCRLTADVCAASVRADGWPCLCAPVRRCCVGGKKLFFPLTRTMSRVVLLWRAHAAQACANPQIPVCEVLPATFYTSRCSHPRDSDRWTRTAHPVGMSNATEEPVCGKSLNRRTSWRSTERPASLVNFKFAEEMLVGLVLWPLDFNFTFTQFCPQLCSCTAFAFTCTADLSLVRVHGP